MSARLLACAAGCLALALSILAYQEFRLVGFPDGFVSNWDRTRKILYLLFIGASLPTSAWFVSLGWTAARRAIRARLRATAIAYAVFVALVLVADHYLRELSGRGG
jgi:hypothetical protein